MAGQIKMMLDSIIAQKSKGNKTLVSTTKTLLIIKGFNPDKFTVSTEDNPDMIRKIQVIANDMGVKL